MTFFAFLIAFSACFASGQAPAGPPANSPAVQPSQPAQDGEEAAPHRGQVIIQSHGEAPPVASEPSSAGQARVPEPDAKVDVSDAERGAVAFRSYDLDARLNLERSGLSVRARVVVVNQGTAPLRQLPLQISSTLRWESATLIEGDRRTRLTLAQHRLDTDADHTGSATEAVLPLPAPLAPGASASLDLFYSGTIAQNGERLARLGASASQQQAADWDAISPEWTGLRGFGDVLWYPVASPQLFMAEGNALFTAIGHTRLRDEAVQMKLRLSVEYTGEPPVGAYFCGRRADLKAQADDPTVPTASGTGVASAEFAAAPLGFRVPSLFVLEQPEVMLGPGASSAGADAGPAFSSSTAADKSVSPADNSQDPKLQSEGGAAEPVIALVSNDTGTGPGLGAAAARVVPLLTDWLGARPLSALTVLDHNGQPYQDGPLLVAPAATLETSPEAPAMVYSLTHAWVQTGQPWVDEGLAQFFALLWVEREHGRDAAVAQMNELLQPVAAFEPDFSAKDTQATAGQPLVAATDELIYRRKAAAVWWMLREICGEKAMHAALSAWRTQPESQDAPAAQAVAFEHLLERLSGKDLGWFFQDWVLRDRGLPDLTIADVQTTQTPAGPGHNTGWLVAVTVRNEGAAVADVPLVVRSGQFSTTQRMRVPGLSQATERVLVEAPPTAIAVNDGSVPEVRTSVHTREINVKQQ